MEIVRINNEIKPLFWIALQKIWYQNAALLQKPKRKKKDGKAFWINLIMAKHLFFFSLLIWIILVNPKISNAEYCQFIIENTLTLPKSDTSNGLRLEIWLVLFMAISLLVENVLTAKLLKFDIVWEWKPGW